METLLDSFMRMQVFKMLSANGAEVPEHLRTESEQANLFLEQYNALVDRMCERVAKDLTPTMQKICAALLISPVLISLEPQDELVPKVMPAACPACNKEWKQSPAKGAEFLVLHHEDICRLQKPSITYPTEPIGFWVCTAHAARIHTLHKCIHFTGHIQRDFARILPEPIRHAPTTSWESLTGDYGAKKAIAKWPTSIKDNKYPLVTAFASHRRTLKHLLSFMEPGGDKSE